MEFRYDSVCGIYCGSCPVLVATRSGHLDQLAREYQRDAADLVCRGCRSEARSVYCMTCDLRACAEASGVERCPDCEAFPCEELRAFAGDGIAHHATALSNAQRIRKVGVERWMEEQSHRWRCSCCWTSFTWYDERCPECGSTLYDCRAEEGDLEG